MHYKDNCYFANESKVSQSYPKKINSKFNIQHSKFNINMTPLVSIIMGSTSDLPVMEEAARVLNELQIPFEMNALSAHRTPEKVEEFASAASGRGIKVIIAGAGMAAHLPGVIAAMTPLPVIGVPIKGSLEGLDSLLAIVQMPPGIPVATVAINGARNAGILAAQIIAAGDPGMMKKLVRFKEELKDKIIKANNELSKVKYNYKVD
jgi:5-(carboxyamino)imidazole ribonucleotide mutase